MATFTQQQIRTSKNGVHLVQFQPDAGPLEVTVFQVRGRFVSVLSTRGELIKLNETASRLLIEGEYRPKRVTTVIVYYNNRGETYVGVRQGKLTDEQKSDAMDQVGIPKDPDELCEKAMAFHEIEDGDPDLRNIWDE